MSDIANTVVEGALPAALLLSVAAGAISFVSPCIIPLVPAYVSYITGLSGAELAGEVEEGADPSLGRATSLVRTRVVLGTLLFMAGLAAVFVPLGMAFGSIGESFAEHRRLIEGVVGAVTVFVGCLFAGLFEHLPLGTRQIKISATPRYGLAGAPFVGALVGLGWSPCIGPTLAAVLGLAAATDGASAGRGGLLALAYCVGLGIPFLIFGLAYQRALGVRMLLQQHARKIMRLGGFSLIVLGLMQILGLWTDVIVWVQTALPTPTLPL